MCVVVEVEGREGVGGMRAAKPTLPSVHCSGFSDAANIVFYYTQGKRSSVVYVQL